MKSLILVTASAVALAVAGAGPLYAASPAGSAAPAAPAAAPTTPATMPYSTAAPASEATPAAAPKTAAPETHAAITNTAPAMKAGRKTAGPSMAAASHSGGNWPPVTRSEMRRMQQKLAQAGLYHGRTDGLVGPRTQRALRAYQQRNHLPATASPDAETVASLLGRNAGVGSSTPPAPVAPSSAGTNGASHPAMPAAHK